MRTDMNHLDEQSAGTWRNMLEAVPVRNSAARVVDEGEHSVAVYVRTRRPRYMVPPISWIVPVRKERRVSLDGVGARIWRLCDGHKTVEDVIDAFARNYDLTFHESRVAVTGYMKMLIQRGVLAVVVGEEQVV